MNQITEKLEITLIIATGLVLLLALLTAQGCATQTHKEYFANGQIKVEDSRSGYTGWSAGDHKEMPLSHISIIGN